MTFNVRPTFSDPLNGIAAVALSLFVVVAGGAAAKNHDAQRIERHASHAAKHDRAAGPIEASTSLDRTPD